MLPSSDLSPQPRRHLDQFSRLYTANGRFSSCMSFPLKILFVRGSTPPSNSASLGPPESITQTASPSVQPFLQSSRESVVRHGGHAIHLKITPSHGDLNPIKYMVHWIHPIQHPKRHLDQFSRFCRAHGRQTVPIFYNGCPVPPKLFRTTRDLEVKYP